MRKEVIFSDLGSLFKPSEAISTTGDKTHWRSVPYTCGKISGTLVSSLNDSRPQDISFDPQLTGWYRVYVSQPDVSDSDLQMKLTGDEGFFRFELLRGTASTVTNMEESFWRCCDMTGKSVILTRANLNAANSTKSMLAWLRFVPMDDNEVQAHLQDMARTDTKRIYATDDIHCRLYRYNIDSPEMWESTVIPYEDSDVEWFAVEDISTFTAGPTPTENWQDFAFSRFNDAMVQAQSREFDSAKAMKIVADKGHKIGLKISISQRMGVWGMSFPYDQQYFDNPFYMAHPEFRCVGRDGMALSGQSYAFPEVQQYFIDHLVKMTETGCDAVTLIAHRGGFYVQFEQPVVDRFMALYGEDPRTLPLDEPRLNALHCEIMTEFFRNLRKALDEACPDRRVQIHLRTMWSIYDTKYYAIDCHKLCQEGLIDAIINYPQRYREVLDPAFFENGRIDIEQYHKYLYEDGGLGVIRHSNTNEVVMNPLPDSSGVLQGPDSLAKCVAEWMQLEKTYGTKVYMELMPRTLHPEELHRRLVELYDLGAERIGMWDTYDRVSIHTMWAMARLAGHKEELKTMTPPGYTLHRVQNIAGFDITRMNPRWGG